MNKAVYILILVLSFSSCSKIKQTKRKLTGDWNVVSYKFTNINGLTYNYEPHSGNFHFGECDTDLCDYSFKMQYYNQGVNTIFDQSGSYEFIEKNGEYYELYRNNDLGGVDTIHSARVILLTKDDLLTEFGDISGRHIFVLQKD